MSHRNLSVKIKIPKLLENKLKNKKIKKIYLNFEKSLDINENFIVAVSGGPDSLALAFLAKIYSQKKNLIPKFFIVDHKLRKESSKEAKLVQKVLRKYSIKAEVLTWKGKKPLKKIQSFARKIRFKLLYEKCNRLKIKNILLGHHSEDLIENFFLRMIRGSGLKGLVSLNKKVEINGKNLLRPLLDLKKEDLIFISRYCFDFFIKDPSNQNQKFKRIQIRKLITELKNDGLDENKILMTIKNLKLSNNLVESYVKNNLRKNTFFSIKKHKLFINKIFFDQPHEVIFRSLSESIKLIGRRYHHSRGKKLDKIIKDVKAIESFKRTLGGCIIEKVNQTVILSKES